MNCRPEVLISVRSETEFRHVAAMSVNVIDLKEPGDGPLAPSSVDLWNFASATEVAQVSVTQVSVALGESDQAKSIASLVPPEIAFAKMGPRELDSPGQLTWAWREVRQLLPKSVEMVAVSYSDHRSARCVCPLNVIELAAAEGFQRVLIDTCIKDGRSTLDHLGIDGLADFSRAATDAGMWWALAGSIRRDHLPILEDVGIQPDCIGVRGGVCHDGRESVVSAELCERWIREVSGPLQTR